MKRILLDKNIFNKILNQYISELCKYRAGTHNRKLNSSKIKNHFDIYSCKNCNTLEYNRTKWLYKKGCLEEYINLIRKEYVQIFFTYKEYGLWWCFHNAKCNIEDGYKWYKLSEEFDKYFNN